MSTVDMRTIDGILKFGKKAKGRAERIKSLESKKLTRHEAILANCYDCQGGYCDGVKDCEIETCLFYQYRPYRDGKKG
jgi:hypothetical protein